MLKIINSYYYYIIIILINIKRIKTIFKWSNSYVALFMKFRQLKSFNNK